MKVEFADVNETRKRLTVEIPVETVDAEHDRVTARLARTVKVPGFRPGKVPVHVIRQRFRDDILHEVAHSLVPRALDEALDQRSLDPDRHAGRARRGGGAGQTADLHRDVRDGAGIRPGRLPGHCRCAGRARRSRRRRWTRRSSACASARRGSSPSKAVPWPDHDWAHGGSRTRGVERPEQERAGAPRRRHDRGGRGGQPSRIRRPPDWRRARDESDLHGHLPGRLRRGRDGGRRGRVRRGVQGDQAARRAGPGRRVREGSRRFRRAGRPARPGAPGSGARSAARSRSRRCAARCWPTWRSGCRSRCPRC